MVNVNRFAFEASTGASQTGERTTEVSVEEELCPRKNISGPLVGLSTRASSGKAARTVEDAGSTVGHSTRAPAHMPLDRLRQNFKVGVDRLYGLDSWREEVQEHIEDHLSADDSYYSSDVTIDRINNRMGLSLPGSRPLGAFKPDSSGPPTDQAFYAFLIGQEGERGKTFDLRDKDDRIRRACKLGVDFSAQQGGTVHFLLGGIQSSMNDVVNKRNYSRHGNKDFTASELRYIYRNKERLGNVVQFYDRQRQATEAPWERDPGVWSQYRPHEIHHSWPRTPGSTGAPAGSPQLSPMSSMPATQADSNTLFLSALAQLSRLAQRSASPSPTTEDDGDASTS
jgi:hypothetical protein